MKQTKNNVAKRLEDETPVKLAKTTKEELMYYLSPVYSEKQLKDLDEDQLKDLLDEVIDRVYKINMKRGGIIKDPTFNVYSDGGSVKPSVSRASDATPAAFRGRTKKYSRHVGSIIKN